MTPPILENISSWLVDWSLVTIMGNTTPPRDPNDEDDEDDEDNKDDKDDDEDDENDDDERHDEPAVVREPDEYSAGCASAALVGGPSRKESPGRS